MGTHNIYLYKEVDKKYAGCILKTTELFDCALILVCAVIGSNTVFITINVSKFRDGRIHFRNSGMKGLRLGLFHVTFCRYCFDQFDSVA